MNKIPSAEDLEKQNSQLIDEIIRLSDFSFERLPMLDIIGQRLAEGVSIALPNLTRLTCEASLTQLDYVPYGQVQGSIPDPAMYAICAGEPLDGEFLIALDSTLILVALELMLGGDAKTLPAREGAGFTAIEKGFGKRLADLVLEEFRHSLSVATASELDVVALETDAESAAITQPTSLCVYLKFSVALAGHIGRLELVLPYDALQPIRQPLGRIHFGERSDGEGVWRDQMSAQIERAFVGLEVVLAERTVTIGDILGWRNGDVLDLMVSEDHEAAVLAAEKPLFRVAMGKRNNGKTAVRITEILTGKEELEDVVDIH